MIKTEINVDILVSNLTISLIKEVEGEDTYISVLDADNIGIKLGLQLLDNQINMKLERSTINIIGIRNDV